MTVVEKIESYLVTLDYAYERFGDTGWLITNHEQGIQNLIVIAEEPVVILRSSVMRLPEGDRLGLYEELLRLNAGDMIHGAYGIDGDDVVLIDTLNTDSLGFDSFQASLDAIGMALSQHRSVLETFR